MLTPGEFWRRFRFLLQRRRLERELAEEMRQHAQWQEEKNIAAGMPSEEARAAAQRRLGNVTRQREESRQSWGFPLLESMAQDVRYGLRGLRQSPGFTTVAMLTLALGIGASTAIFSIVNAVLLRPLPYADSSRLAHIWTVSPQFPEFQMGQSKPDFDDLKKRNRSFEAMALYQGRRLNLTGMGEPEELVTAAVTSDFFSLFSVHAAQGRTLQPADEEGKNGNVVVLSHGLWQRRFAGATDILGKTVNLDGKLYTVAGVMPEGFSYPENTVAWTPLTFTKEELNRTHWMSMALGKLRAPVSVRSAQTEMDTLAAQLGKENPKEDEGTHFKVMTLRDGVLGTETKPELAILAGAVMFVLLIGCANVSNLILSRGIKRQREIAVRAALGASRSRILRQLLVESLLLAACGGTAGVLLAAGGIRAFRAFAPAGFARLQEIHLDPAVAMIALLVSSLAGVLCGLAPALHTSRADLNLGLKDRSAGAAAAPHRFSLRNFLVVSEVALALVLLTGAALMVKSLARLTRVDAGFRTDHLLSAHITLPKERYASDDAQQLFLRRLLEALRSEPQFTGLAISNNSLMTHSTSLIAFDPETLGLHQEHANLESIWVSPEYFASLGIPVKAGRAFDDHDGKEARQVAMVNESMARRFFSGQDPIGKTLKFDPGAKTDYMIVGVAADTRDIHVSAAARPEVYFPLLQHSPSRSRYVMVRSSADPASVVKLLQARIWSVDKDLPLNKVSSMTEIISQSIAEPRFRTWLLTAFASAGLLLTLIGIYGVISYSVSQRTQEIGIRIALGASQENVLRLVLRQGVRLALLGSAIGIAGSLLLMRLLASQLYEVKPTDPFTLMGTALLMLGIALGASYIPAHRATRVDPMVALRDE